MLSKYLFRKRLLSFTNCVRTYVDKSKCPESCNDIKKAKGVKDAECKTPDDEETLAQIKAAQQLEQELKDCKETLEPNKPNIVCKDDTKISEGFKGPEGPKEPEQPIYRMRLKRAQPSKVELGFIPQEWFHFFHKRTGISGPYMFMVSISTYLISKEIYVMEHEYYSGLSIIILLYIAAIKIGPQFGKFLDKNIDEYEAQWNSSRINEKKNFEEGIKLETELQESVEGQLMLLDAKRENVGLQLEAAYRGRLLEIHKEVKRRLDYQASKASIKNKFMRKNLTQWVVEQVIAAYTEEKDKELLNNCFDQLSALAAKQTSIK